MIPVCKPWLPGNEEKYILDAIRTNWISSAGQYIERFEEEFARYCGVKYGVCCTSGLAALHLACAALDLKKGDEVIVPTFTMAASVNAIIFTGAKPVLIDCDAETYCIDVDKIEEKITPRTKAIMPVHIYGHPCEMKKIIELANKYSLYIIEDAAEAHGAEYNKTKCGAMSDIGCFSFYANKIITTGEGGMLITNSKNIADKARSLHSLSYGNNKNKFMHESIGFNYRMSNIIAAFGCAQLENINKVIDMKRTMAKYYNEGLSNISSLQLPIEKDYARSVYWMYHVVLRGKWLGKRERVMGFLKENGVETRESFVPFNKQKIFIEKNITKENECPVANLVGENGFYLPSGPVISEEELNYTISLLKEFLK